MKTCSTCKIEKPVSEFHKRSSNPDGLQGVCKKCRKKRSAKWYSDNKEPHNSKRKAWKQKRILDHTVLLVEYLRAHPCVDCGEDDPMILDCDHVRGDKVGHVTSMLCRDLAPWSTILAEIGKCEIRCANCHRKKTAKEGNFLRYQITRP